MDYKKVRLQMVEQQLRRRDIRDEEVLRAMETVPRERFVPRAFRREAYADSPLPLGPGQTISQPYIVAFMSQALGLSPGERVLEVGTGSGYQAAVLAELGAHVFSIEIDPVMSSKAGAALAKTGYDRVSLRSGDGRAGWPEEAPFDVIMLTAAPATLPEALREQLADGGRLILPLGELRQELVLLSRKGDEFSRESLLSVSFVPLREL